MQDHSAFFDHIGYKKHVDKKSRVTLDLPVKSEVVNEDGTLSPGLFSTMLDIVIGSTVNEEFKSPASTINLNTTYFDLSNKGPYRAYASITHQAEKVITGEGIVEDCFGEMAAKGIGTFKLLSESKQ